MPASQAFRGCMSASKLTPVFESHAGCCSITACDCTSSGIHTGTTSYYRQAQSLLQAPYSLLLCCMPHACSARPLSFAVIVGLWQVQIRLAQAQAPQLRHLTSTSSTFNSRWNCARPVAHRVSRQTLTQSCTPFAIQHCPASSLSTQVCSADCDYQIQGLFCARWT